MKAIDLTGLRFGKLLVIEKNEEISKERKRSHWTCQCDCGKTCVVVSQKLKSGHTKSCGCLKNEEATKRIKKYNEENPTRTHTEETKKKISEGHKGAKNPMYGLFKEEHPRYNPNITEKERTWRRDLDEEHRNWAKNVKEKADFTCDICRQIGGKLVSHHLDGYNWCKEKRYAVENGVCLCENCHKNFHKEYGQKNNPKEQYLEYKKQKAQSED